MSDDAQKRKALGLARLKRSRQHLKSASDLLLNDDYADSIGRSYYAIFQSVRALLAINGLDSRKHSGVVSLFNRHFIKTGKLGKHWAVVLKDARRSREMADYTEIAEFSRQDAAEQIADAEAFIQAVESLIAKTE